MAVLLTGGAGYIGSHCAVSLVDSGFDIVVLDNLSNSSFVSIQRVKELTGKNIVFIKGDVSDSALLKEIFTNYDIDGVIHLAGFKSVFESKTLPLNYYSNNFSASIVLLKVMNEFKIRKLIFSSSATVYGVNSVVPYSESTPKGIPASPYSASKSMVEQLLEDLAASDSTWQITSLRYFNPVGAHESGLIGEDPKGIPNNLMPFISQVAVGRLKMLSIYGSDYPTLDGTCRRDYLHVMDVAEGHVAALSKIGSGFEAINLGTGTPVSVLEMVRSFERVNDVSIPFEFVERRIGDLAEFWADPSKAKLKLDWGAKRSVDQMMEDTWRWQITNPNGYSE